MGDGADSGARDPWPSYMQTIGIFTKDVGLPGTFALVLLYVVVRFLPAQTLAVARTSAAVRDTTSAVQRVAEAIGHQTDAIHKLSDDIAEHRRWTEQNGHGSVSKVGP